MNTLTQGFEKKGYVEKTTFGTDFDLADILGIEAIRDTFERAFTKWKDNCEYFTELVLVLNHKYWQWHYIRKQRMEAESYAEVYSNLFYKYYYYGIKHFKGDELSYYYHTIENTMMKEG